MYEDVVAIRRVGRSQRWYPVTSRTRLVAMWIYPSVLYVYGDRICIVDPSNRICLLHVYMGSVKVCRTVI